MSSEGGAAADSPIYEGKAKKLYKTADGHILHQFKDSATAFNGEKKAEIPGKGELNAQISAHIFSYLEKQGLRNHFIEFISPRSLKTYSLQMIPLEVLVRNRVAGSLAKRLSEKEGALLSPPVIEWCYKDDARGDPQISEGLLISYYKYSQSVIDELKAISLRVNELLLPLFAKAQINLVDFKLEFGKTSDGSILLGDEISPDTCRLWDQKTGEKLDKDRFRFDLGDLMTGYREIWRRLSESL